MKVGILQFRPRLGDVDGNLATIRRFLIRRRFDLAVLPELATTGYNFVDREQAQALAETRRGPSFRFFRDLAAATGGAIVWGTVEKDRDRLYNSAVLTTPEGRQYVYRKTHLFFREKEIFDPGDTGFRVVSWRGVRIGLMICFDWIFPEAARTLTLKRAQLICHPSNLVMHYCQDAMVTRSIENGVFCLTANRVGTEKNDAVSLTFTGGSQVTAERGERVLRFSRTEQSFKTVKISPQAADKKDVNRYNDIMADRRVGFYKI